MVDFGNRNEFFKKIFFSPVQPGNTTKMKKRIWKIPRWLLIFTCIYVTILTVISFLNQVGADRWWFGAFNLYLPQAIWIVPCSLLLILYLKSAVRRVWIPLLLFLWVLGPIMGFCWPFFLKRDLTGNPTVRVMTWNVKWGGNDKLNELMFVYELDWRRPDVILLQDVGVVLNGPLGKFLNDWNVRTFGQYIIASRFSLSEGEVRYISFYGQKHTYLKCDLLIGDTKIALYNLHFQTPRFGLNAFRAIKRKPWYLPNAIQEFEENIEARLIQAQTIEDFVNQEKGPVIVAGDLNSPDASMACARLRKAGLHDAFAEAGKGYGYTYGHFLIRNRLPWINFSWMRIDHIMVSSHFQTIRCRTGTEEAAEHRPVIADLTIRH
jgi:vancomycin resistance protein VanJ